MVYVLTGENSLEAERELKKITRQASGAVESYDGSSLELWQLPELLGGQTLFAEKRCVVIKRLTENAAIWRDFHEWLERVSDNVTLVLMEPTPDKRSKTWKALQKQATVKEFPAWSKKDLPDAVEWVRSEARRHHLDITSAQARYLVGRVGMNQWHLFHALEKLALQGDASREMIDAFTELHPDENVFALLEVALAGDIARLRTVLGHLRQSEDPYRMTGLLNTQLLQLAALVYSSRRPQELAADLKVAPFVLSKLAGPASRLSQPRMDVILHQAAEADHQLKSAGADPWVIIDTLLLKIAHQK